MISDVDRIVYFGDSLTDSGALFEAAAKVSPIGFFLLFFGYDGQASNGPVYADFVPELLGVEGGESLNFAVAASRVLTEVTLGEFLEFTGLIYPGAAPEDLAFRMEFAGQVERFLADEASEGDLSTTAASIFVGLNDINDFPLAVPDPVSEAVGNGVGLAATVVANALPLSLAGVGTLIFNTFPSIRVFPLADTATEEELSLGDIIVDNFNVTLRAAAPLLTLTGADVHVVEFGAIFEEVAADYESFGFQAFDEPFYTGDFVSGEVLFPELNPAVQGVPIDQIAYFDVLHPTTTFHGILGAFQAESLTSDVTIGDDTGEVIRTGRGPDLVLGREGNDDIGLGKGDDVAIAGLGDDIVSAGRGNDLVSGGAGDDEIFGRAGNDILVDGGGDDTVAGGAGADLLIDGDGSDQLWGNGDNDIFVFTEATLFGRAPGDENIFYGGGGEDLLVLRVADAAVDLGFEALTSGFAFNTLNVTAIGIENFVVVEGTDLAGEPFYSAQFEQAELWNFV